MGAEERGQMGERGPGPLLNPAAILKGEPSSCLAQVKNRCQTRVDAWQAVPGSQDLVALRIVERQLPRHGPFAFRTGQRVADPSTARKAPDREGQKPACRFDFVTINLEKTVLTGRGGVANGSE